VKVSIYSQSWVDCKIDSTVGVFLPDNYQIENLQGQKTITANADNAFVMASKIPNIGDNAMVIENEREVIDFYKGFQNGLLKSHKGELIKEESIDKFGLKCMQFSYSATQEDEKQTRYCLVFFANQAIYSFSFWEAASMTEQMKPVRDKFFESIKSSANFSLQNQLTSSGEENYEKMGSLVGTLFGIITGIIIIIWMVRRKKKKVIV
jgi:hypothetical protein